MQAKEAPNLVQGDGTREGTLPAAYGMVVRSWNGGMILR
jgi:hypothetical protein